MALGTEEPAPVAPRAFLLRAVCPAVPLAGSSRGLRSGHCPSGRPGGWFRAVLPTLLKGIVAKHQASRVQRPRALTTAAEARPVLTGHVVVGCVCLGDPWGALGTPSEESPL